VSETIREGKQNNQGDDLDNNINMEDEGIESGPFKASSFLFS